ncbi:hypothetical protein L6164_013285 [Bauhinia variegata]|uniref:Uncharacterized protein n=1 Tax=Bauhinia variegata TaxID=167791 RepID=A0ACB9PFE2_BAUVA|nr:hypothetical protein L6164_013285 [Bauhinia variegata]
MKSPMLLNASFFFFFVLLATTLPSTRAKNAFDTDGNPIISGQSYYIIPVNTNSGGGPTLSQTGDDTCPLTVVQDADTSSTGLPARLTDYEAIYHVEEDALTRIAFIGNGISSCAPSAALWAQVGKYVKIVDTYSEIYYGFRFLRYSSSPYTYYMTACFDPMLNCSPVITNNGTLVVSNSGDPWVVKFKRAYKSSESDSWSIV